MASLKWPLILCTRLDTLVIMVYHLCALATLFFTSVYLLTLPSLLSWLLLRLLVSFVLPLCCSLALPTLIHTFFTPDIEKTYNPPPVPVRRSTTPTNETFIQESRADDVPHLDQAANRHFYSNYFRRDLIVFKNFDLFRSSDFASLLVMFYAAYVPLFAMSGSNGVTFSVAQALVWRVFHSYVLGALLHRQSTDKFITRHFLKWGGVVQDAYNNWKR